MSRRSGKVAKDSDKPKTKKRTNKCGSVILKCEMCDHEMELNVTSKRSRIINEKDSKAIELEGKTENKSTTRELSVLAPTTAAEEKKEIVAEEKKGVATEEKKLVTVSALNALNALSDLPVMITVDHLGFWITNSSGKHEPTTDETCERNSVMLSPKCLLYIYKLALRHLLISKGVIIPDDIDAANLVPHVVVRKSKNDPFSKYKSIQGEQFIIEESMLSPRSDFLTIELDEKRDLHCTMIYSKKIKNRVDLVAAFKEMLHTLNSPDGPRLIEEYASLPYFGLAAIDYWAETTINYPRNITPPSDYVPKPKEKKVMMCTTSAAGSILTHIPPN